jgi:CheY-like chemotaxis protein
MKQIAGVDSKQFKLLLVDDIPLNILLLEKMLQPYEFQIAKANNGRQALELIQERQDTPDSFDLAIMDLMMPDIDGFQVIKSVRGGCDNEEFHIEAKDKDEFPLIILSGMNFEDDIAQGLKMGANQFLTKPVVMERLYAAVTEELTKKVQHDQANQPASED